MDAPGLQDEIENIFGLQLPIIDWSKEEGIADEEMRERITDAVERRAAERAANFGPELMRHIEKTVLLQTLDADWREHIIQLEHLRQYVGLRGYGQRDPLNEYKSEALTLFENLLLRLRTNVVRLLMTLQINRGEPPPVEERELPPMEVHHIDPLTGETNSPPRLSFRPRVVRLRDAAETVDPNDTRTWGKVSRNATCPCGSGKEIQALPRRPRLALLVATNKLKSAIPLARRSPACARRSPGACRSVEIGVQDRRDVERQQL